MILIINANQARLCQDNCWRSFANFGTYPECVKEYRSLGHAKNKAKKVKGFVVLIPKDFEVDAVGTVFEREPISQTSEILTKHQLREFKIPVEEPSHVICN